ncbi:MAG: hypothetical protein P9M02_04880 [Candidatus Susulua stagnicola]|nr:hypothetical protein [Candidatus Susulua stagnicola]
MKNKNCIKCGQYKNCKDTSSSWVFVIIGMIATIAVRVVTILMNVNPFYGKIAWYIGVIGFFIFFIYKFKVSQSRAQLIVEKNLIVKINNNQQLAKDDYVNVGELLCSLVSRKERLNYFFIFALSALALIFAIYMDFIK